MDSKKVPGSKISAIIMLLMIGSSVSMGGGGDAKQDSWIAMLCATGAMVLIAWLYSAILRLHPGKNLFDICFEVFGNVGGKIICVLYGIYAIYLGARIFALYDNFIRIVNLDTTPMAAIVLVSAPLIAGVVKCGLKTWGSCAKFVSIIVVILTGVTCVLGFHYMKLDNIRPILASGLKPILLSTGFYMTLPLGETVMCLSFFGEVDKKENAFKILAKGVLFGGVFLAVIILRNLLLLGAPTSQLFTFTSYDAVGIISIGDFVTRISVIVGVELTLTGVAKLSVFIYTASQAVSKTLNLKKYLQPAAPCCALMVALSLTLYNNIQTELKFVKYVSLFNIPIQFILPILVLVVGKIRLGKKKKGATKKAAPAKSGNPVSEEAEF